MKTIKNVKQLVKQADPNIEESSKEFRAAVCLLSSAIVGCNASKVSFFTGYPQKECAQYAKRWRKSGVWTKWGPDKKSLIASDWGDEETGGISFWMDVTVGLGYTERVPA